MNSEVPRLSGDALRAVRHRGSHLQIIACAGSGKTEVVSQRVAALLAEGVEPEGIVAFTFTERAAEELKLRIEERVAVLLGRSFVDRMNGCYVGTIHAYCWRLLQRHVPRYETYNVLDDHRLAAFLTRVAPRIGLKDLTGALYSSLKAFARNLDVVDNELITPAALDEPLRSVLVAFLEQLDAHRLLTYGQLVRAAVDALDDPGVHAAVHEPLRHLVVDEYQDINPAQEVLIERLTRRPVELCVVGDDDQAIYQWRGSDVGNIVTFEVRYPNVARFDVTTNRRSQPEIITHANRLSAHIEGRLNKAMRRHRDGEGPQVQAWRAPSEADEAETIASTIVDLAARGHRYRDIAVLVRSSASYGRLLDAFERHGIPVQPAGRTGLFAEPKAKVFGRTFAWLGGIDWRERYGSGEPVDLDDLVDEYRQVFRLRAAATRHVAAYLQEWGDEVVGATRPANLVRDFYELLRRCSVDRWSLDDPQQVARLGTLACCSAVLADYESVKLRARPDPASPGEQQGGQNRGKWFYFWLAIHIVNWAQGGYEGFEGEDSLALDAVDLTTVHQAKGLEWPVAFVPSVSAGRFPSVRTAQPGDWWVPGHLFDCARYEGSLNDERRLFYVAVTRARDWLSVSTHNVVTKKAVGSSPFLTELWGDVPPQRSRLDLPAPPTERTDDREVATLSFSDLATFDACGHAYRLRHMIGFQPPIAPELGYGHAVHHVLREVAEETRRRGRPPTDAQLDRLFDEEFYLPTANRPAHRQMKRRARALVDRYVRDYGEDLHRVWAVERPFELHLPNTVLTGRADVILDESGGRITSLSIVDYKAATDEPGAHDFQLQVYADAGRREGLPVEAAYVHDLYAGDRVEVPVDHQAVTNAEARVASIVQRMREGRFEADPGPQCGRCDVQAICRYAAS